MNCPNCGNEVRGNFCTNCGTRIEQEQASPPTPSEIDPGATAAIRPGDLTNLAERESAGPQPPGPAASDPGATAMMRPEDLQGLRSGAQQPPTGPGMGRESQRPYEAPSPGPADQQPYGGQSAGSGGQPPYETPGAGPTPTPPSGGNWARELGVASPQTSYGGPAGGPQRLVFPGGISMVMPPGISQVLAPLEPVGKQYLAWIGAVLLFIGTFLSTKTYSVSAGILGSFSGSDDLWQWASFIWPLLIVLLALASAGVAFLRDYKWLVVTGGVSFLILILQFLYTFSTGVSVSGLSAHPSWGWIILFPAALLILAAGVMRPGPRDNPDDHGLERLLDQSRNRTGAR